MKVELPKKKIHKTPRLLMSDAYTVGGDLFQSPEAKELSVYYITFRRELADVNPFLYEIGDNRIVFYGLSRILEYLFYEPITHEEIDETKRFLSTYKANMNGLKPYYFNEDMWRIIVDEYNGRPPIKIEALPEGSVTYPNEPCVQITSMVQGWGELAAYFESKILQLWATTQRATANRHWYSYLTNMIKKVDPELTDEEVAFNASIMLHDFGDRAGICASESEILGETHLLSFGGTDTVAGGYQAWKNAGEIPGIATSVYAHAHRTIQPNENERDAYERMYVNSESGDFLSMVADCYDFKNAVKEYLLPLAIKSRDEKANKVIVCRPDSGDALEQIMYVLNLAVENGLYTTKGDYKYSTTLKVIEGDGMDWKTMKTIFEEIKKRGFAPFSWLVFGVGGGLRNFKRDDFSAKYALSAKGQDEIGVIKLSEVEGKHTLPGPFKLLRDPESLSTGITIVDPIEKGECAYVEYYNGARLEKPFGPGQDDDFLTIKDRIQNDFDSMPRDLGRKFPASNNIIFVRDELVKKFAPNK